MSVSTRSPKIQTLASGGPNCLGYDFAFLGLEAREARVEAIRRAARSTASRIQRGFVDNPQEMSELRSELAISTYRLLDPRRRQHMLERVVLSVPSEADLELNKLARQPLLDVVDAGAADMENATTIRPAVTSSAAAGLRNRQAGQSTPRKLPIGHIASTWLAIVMSTIALAELVYC